MNTRIHNEATGTAKVDVQVGVIHGNATFYHYGDRPSPAERYRVGLNYLRGNMPRKAAELIRAAVHSGFAGPDVAYYWALAILSGRPFDHVTETDFDELTNAFDMATRYSAVEQEGQWLQALRVLLDMVQSLAAYDLDRDADGITFSDVMARYESLVEERRDEIRRHLDMIIAGAIQDLIDESDAEAIRHSRMDGDRTRRASAFFEPPAAPPQMRPLVSTLNPDAGGSAGCGGFLLVAAVVLTVVVLSSATLIGALVAMAMLAGGAGLVGTARFDRIWAKAQRRWSYPHADARLPKSQLSTLLSQARMQLATATSKPGRTGTPRPAAKASRHPTKLEDNIGTLLEDAFARHAPDGFRASLWLSETEAIRSSAEIEMIYQYNWQNAKSAPQELGWLATWHAIRAASHWKKHGQLYSQEPEPKWATRMFLGSALVLAGMVGTVYFAWQQSWLTGIGLALMLPVGALLVLYGAPVETANSRVKAADTRYRDEEFEQQQQAFDDWKRRQAERQPSDDEMARWLDYDKAYLKSLALDGFALRNRDLIGHFALTQSVPGCKRARVLYGPPRYSVYLVRLFLLTERGIWEFSAFLDFISGDVLHPQTRTLSYDSIVSTEVAEVSIQFAGDGQRTVHKVDRDNRAIRRDQLKLTLAHALYVTLENGNPITALIENFDAGLIDRAKENIESLEELSRDAAGVSGALRILQAVAVEGSHWVEEQRKRRRRRLLAYRDKQRRRREVGAGPPPLDFGRQLPPSPL